MFGLPPLHPPTMLQPLVSAVSANPLASTIVLMALGYLATKVALLLLDFRRINKQIENMPTLPKYGVLHYILGTIEYVWYQLGNMRLEEGNFEHKNLKLIQND